MIEKTLLPRTIFTRRGVVLGAGVVGAAAVLGLRGAAAQVRLQITEGNFQPMPIAIPIIGRYMRCSTIGSAIGITVDSMLSPMNGQRIANAANGRRRTWVTAIAPSPTRQSSAAAAAGVAVRTSGTS